MERCWSAGGRGLQSPHDVDNDVEWNGGLVLLAAWSVLEMCWKFHLVFEFDFYLLAKSMKACDAGAAAPHRCLIKYAPNWDSTGSGRL